MSKGTTRKGTTRKAFVFESTGDCSSGIYAKRGDEWVLVAVIDPESAENENHIWPKTATGSDMARWKTHCTYKPVELLPPLEKR